MKDSEIPPSHQYADSDEASHIYLLPNSLTAGNLFFGFLAIMRCIEANYATDPAIINGHFFDDENDDNDNNDEYDVDDNDDNVG